MTSIAEIFDIPESVHQGDFVLRLTEGVNRPDETLRNYVVTYDGIVFHRVIPGFMAQTGDPTGTGTGSSDKPNVAAEFSQEPHVRGTVSMARSASPDSANSQFFICFADCTGLNGQYTAFGKVVSGMDHIDAIKKGAKGGNGEVSDPDCIVKMSLAE